MKALVLVLCLAFTGCLTVVQHPVPSQQASFDGNDQNSGVIAKTDAGFVVSSNFRDRYNVLIETYSNSKLQDGTPLFIPPIKKDFGIKPNSDGTFTINKQAMVVMIQLSGMKRRAFKP